MAQYMLLIYGDPAAAPSGADLEAEYEAWLNYTNSLMATGSMISGAPLEAATAATTVRERNGETVASDGPFAETKEILGGYYLIDVPDRETAVSLAAKMPNIGYGSVEVRPVVVFPASA
jgi:hypothetical protein